MSLPDWLKDKLASPPEAGAGIHAWLFSCARQLHAHMPAGAVEAALSAATAGATRKVTSREIRDAVRNSLAVAWAPEPAKRGARSVGNADSSMPSALPSPSPDRWPEADPVARRCRVADARADGVGGLCDLWERSPVRPNIISPDDWLDILLPGAEWLCLAVDHPATARSRRREKWTFGAADECGLIVPSPMTGPSGKGLDGRTSHRCLGNTGPRRWLVIEFDSGSIDEQASLHWHLAEAAKAVGWPGFALAVHSGGKSLHGWYGIVGSEDLAHELMAYAVSLGADPATWNRCQLIRLPGGVRPAKETPPHNLPEGWPEPAAQTRQEVFYFSPLQCILPPLLNPNSSAPGALAGSMPPLAPMAG